MGFHSPVSLCGGLETVSQLNGTAQIRSREGGGMVTALSTYTLRSYTSCHSTSSVFFSSSMLIGSQMYRLSQREFESHYTCQVSPGCSQILSFFLRVISNITRTWSPRYRYVVFLVPSIRRLNPDCELKVRVLSGETIQGCDQGPSRESARKATTSKFCSSAVRKKILENHRFPLP